jgi:hypothetical protein
VIFFGERVENRPTTKPHRALPPPLTPVLVYDPEARAISRSGPGAHSDIRRGQRRFPSAVRKRDTFF